MQDMEIMAERHNDYLLNKYLDEISIPPTWYCKLCDVNEVEYEDDICDECQEYIDFVHAIVHLGTDNMQEYALETCDIILNSSNDFSFRKITELLNKEK